MTAVWQPSSDINVLKRRAQIISDVRRFFNERGVWEVETPILSQSAPTSPYIDSFATHYSPIGSDIKQVYFLHTSPEFAMKRMLAAGSGAIFQIAKVFRNGEQGRYHAPEFTMLEWYRPEFTLAQLMDEVEAFISRIFNQTECIRISYQQVFRQYLDLEVFDSSDKKIESCAKSVITGLPDNFQTDRDGYLDLLMSHIIEPKLATQNAFIYDFPASQAQLAKTKKDEAGNEVAERFELYVKGIEIANGYHELLDANECRLRFEKDNQQRESQSKPLMPVDEHLLSAMEAGMPECSGVALGLDRMIMLAENKAKLTEVISFAFEQS